MNSRATRAFARVLLFPGMFWKRPREELPESRPMNSVGAYERQENASPACHRVAQATMLTNPYPHPDDTKTLLGTIGFAAGT